MVLVALDFDGSLSQTDMTVLLGREYDVAHEVRGLAEQGLRGEIDVPTSLRQRVSLLRGMPERLVDAAFDHCKLREGAADLVGDLRRSDVSVAIVTGGFERGVERALDRAGVAVDHVVANRLVAENGALTGEVDGPLVEGRKEGVLQELAVAEGVPIDRTIAVGDGTTDLRMLQVAGTGIGFDPAPVVEKHCDVVVTSVGKLRLYLEQHGVIDAERIRR